MMMEQDSNSRLSLLAHYQRYPLLQIQDIFKYIYQSAFGCEHLVSSVSSATEYLKREYATCARANTQEIDALNGAYSRVHLSVLDRGLCAETLAKLFVASAKKEPNGHEHLLHQLAVVRELIKENKLPFSVDTFEKEVRAWAALEYSAIHHSEVFRANYAPSYRVIANEYLPFLPLLTKLDTMLQHQNVVIAIDGASASGKSTLSEMLHMLYDCTVFHMDDFFLRPEQRTAQRYMQIGGNVDRERFLEQVLIPLSRREPVCYQRFDCSTMSLLPAKTVLPQKLTVIEGVYSMHQELAAYYDFSVFLDISPELQQKRIEKRNSQQMAERFYREWIPLEKRYFEQMQVPKRSDMIIPIA